MSVTLIVAMPQASRLRLGRSPGRARDSIRMAVVISTMSLKTSASVATWVPVCSRSCASTTNTQEMTNSDVATMRPSSSSRRGLCRDSWDSSTNDVMAPTGNSSKTISAAAGWAACSNSGRTS